MKILIILLLIAIDNLKAENTELIDIFLNSNFKEAIYFASSLQPFTDKAKVTDNKYYQIKIVRDRELPYSWLVTCYTNEDPLISDIPDENISRQFLVDSDMNHKNYLHLNSIKNEHPDHSHQYCNNNFELLEVLTSICNNETWLHSTIAFLVKYYSK